MSGLSGPMGKPPAAAWRAQRGTTRHAFLATERGRVIPKAALCGYPWFDERWIRADITEKCADCLAALDRLTVEAMRGPASIDLGL